MATLHFTERDRDDKGFIAIEPRSLADLMPQHSDIRQDAKRKLPTKHEYAALAAVTLMIAFVLVYTWQTPQTAAPAHILPTAYIAPAPTHAPQPTPTLAPTSAPEVVYITLPTPPPDIVYVQSPPEVVYVEAPVVEEQAAPTPAPMQTIAVQPGDEPMSVALMREAMDK